MLKMSTLIPGDHVIGPLQVKTVAKQHEVLVLGMCSLVEHNKAVHLYDLCCRRHEA
jgi:hypothetical protein